MQDSGHPVVTLCAVGDVTLDRPHPHTAFDLARPLLAGADITYGDCEAVYSDLGSPVPGIRGVARARGDLDNVRALSGAGFDVMSFANNHHLDRGYEAFLDTLRRLEDAGISTCGAGRDLQQARKPAVIERRGVKVAFLAYSSILLPGFAAEAAKPGCAPIRVATYYRQAELEQPGTRPAIVTVPDAADLDAMHSDVMRAKELADIVVIAPHWGIHFAPIELASYESVVGRIAIDAGADLVLGSHQHILKGVEVYKSKVIFHGLNNFVVDVHMAQHVDNAAMAEMNARYPGYGLRYYKDYPSYPFHPDARRTCIVSCKIEDRAISEVAIVPAYINSHGQPEPLTADNPRFTEVADYIIDISARAGLDTEFSSCSDRLIVVTSKERNHDKHGS
jgi:Bacterial capsule synthesis protein PGA_cap